MSLPAQQLPSDKSATLQSLLSSARTGVWSMSMRLRLLVKDLCSRSWVLPVRRGLLAQPARWVAAQVQAAVRDTQGQQVPLVPFPWELRALLDRQQLLG